MKQKAAKDNYIEDLKEYQDKQYLPGYYVGGKLPLALKYPTRRLGWLFLFLAALSVVFGLISWSAGDFSWSSIMDGGIGNLLPLVIIILYLLIAIKLLSKKK